MNQLFESKNTWRLNSLQVFMMVLTRYWIEYCLECITERIKHARDECSEWSRTVKGDLLFLPYFFWLQL